jgi:hypothetical protein
MVAVVGVNDRFEAAASHAYRCGDTVDYQVVASLSPR